MGFGRILVVYPVVVSGRDTLESALDLVAVQQFDIVNAVALDVMFETETLPDGQDIVAALYRFVELVHSWVGNVAVMLGFAEIVSDVVLGLKFVDLSDLRNTELQQVLLAAQKVPVEEQQLVLLVAQKDRVEERTLELLVGQLVPEVATRIDHFATQKP